MGESRNLIEAEVSRETVGIDEFFIAVERVHQSLVVGSWTPACHCAANHAGVT